MTHLIYAKNIENSRIFQGPSGSGFGRNNSVSIMKDIYVELDVKSMAMRKKVNMSKVNIKLSINVHSNVVSGKGLTKAKRNVLIKRGW